MSHYALIDECAWLWSTTPKMEPDHRWERRAKRLEEAKKEKEEHDEEEAHEGEEKEEKPEENPPPQATGEDNVKASGEKEESAEGSDKVVPFLID
jgi:hypothetical protein